jgi:hypothetical protein
MFFSRLEWYNSHTIYVNVWIYSDVSLLLWTLCLFLVNLSNNMNFTCIYVLYDFWLIPLPVVIWLTYGSMECNIYVRKECTSICPHRCSCLPVYAWAISLIKSRLHISVPIWLISMYFDIRDKIKVNEWKAWCSSLERELQLMVTVAMTSAAECIAHRQKRTALSMYWSSITHTLTHLCFQVPFEVEENFL